MRFVFACQFYHPSQGGVQKVMQEVAEHLVRGGHQVTVVTSWLPERNTSSHNGVSIEQFGISGNRVLGMTGEIERYQVFLRSVPADAILINAAQQWTFDAAWPVLDAIRAKKVLIPCGFSGLYLPQYRSYFEEIPKILGKFDRLIFHAESYRDIDFARQQGLTRFSIIPNGASEKEFSVAPNPRFLASLGISDSDFVILTVGAPIAAKGHAELAAAFALVSAQGRPVTLILNGDWPRKLCDGGKHPRKTGYDQKSVGDDRSESLDVRRASPRDYIRRARGLWGQGGAKLTMRRIARFLLRWGLLRQRTIDDWIAAAEAQPGKRVLKTSLSREDTIQAFLAADLFVCASNVEYSPLVLFEAAAAGTPFLTVPVGNSREIAAWTGGGVVCPAQVDEAGFTRADPAVLAKSIEKLMEDDPLRQHLGQAGRRSFMEKYRWDLIAKSYEAVLSRTTN